MRCNCPKATNQADTVFSSNEIKEQILTRLFPRFSPSAIAYFPPYTWALISLLPFDSW